MDFTCENAARLVPAYLDGELGEARAAPLRQHLMQCVACREVAKDAKNLRRWFVPRQAAAVPSGFAARVARRAFAGDPGGVTALAAAPRADAESDGTAVLPFVLRLTAVAAALLIGLSIAIQLRPRPIDDAPLQATELDEVFDDAYESGVVEFPHEGDARPGRPITPAQKLAGDPALTDGG